MPGEIFDVSQFSSNQKAILFFWTLARPVFLLINSFELTARFSFEIVISKGLDEIVNIPS